MNNLYNKAKQILVKPVGLWGLALLFIVVDYDMGPLIQFPVTFLFPVIVAAWFHSRLQAFLLAFFLPFARLSFHMFAWTAPWSFSESLINALIRATVFLTVAYLVSLVKKQNELLSKEVKTLTGILPICGFCKKIRTDKNEWVPVEEYIRERSEAQFSHSFCPECGREHYGDLVE